MCIVALAWQVLENTPVLILSNRDEFYHRPAQALHYWQNEAFYAGKDLQQGGTWMAVNETGRWAVVTNFRDGRDQRHFATSRGQLIKDFLHSDLSPIRFARQLEQQQQLYAGFNLMMGNTVQAVYMSNRGETPQVLANGVYVVSNALLHDHWQKTAHLRKRFTQEFLPLLQLSNTSLSDQMDAAWQILQDQRKVAQALLPDTGISLELEQLISSTFIQSEKYGTRCSNFFKIINQDMIWLEKTQQGEHAGKIQKIQQTLKTAKVM
ncbi:NRDE family protein [Acinetobacter qingfengensis]|uniref:Serine/threonine protein phosphatase n=1 Tax=Acinetobacter qingfengensis TaxID=1262585 RepID=A0A1E7RDY1_9GAMM|nr:NRDE family protein [Acinetobacter qingfengensis]KAA8734576.1 NRDE family protein [Acinetobacter qingfengensis]OEY97548.1 serine/threonine protein phosphatase [Acinetobacter qingfengensis]